MSIVLQKNIRISNGYYNLALDAAKNRNIFRAVLLLKKSLIFNKKNIDSRNLLGLLFYEEGEVPAAIAMWVVSKYYEPKDNLALYFLDKANNDTLLSKYFESIKVMNIAIDNIKIERYDLAFLQLQNAIELNPKNVKALTIASIISLMLKNHIKAGSYLLKARNVDKGNFLINNLFDYTMSNTSKKEVMERKIKEVYSIKKLESDDAIIPNKYIKLTTNQKIMFTGFGLILGIIFYIVLVLPSIENRIRINANEDVIRYADMINDKNKTIKTLTTENNELKENYEEASIKVKAYEEQNALFTSQYEKLNEIIRLYDTGYISQAAKEYAELNKDEISDESLITLLNQARSKIEGLGAKKLCELGTESWNGGNKTQAISYYQLSLNINPDDPETMFLLARLYQSMNNNTEANKLFDKVIAEHPESNYSRRSREARGY